MQVSKPWVEERREGGGEGDGEGEGEGDGEGEGEGRGKIRILARRGLNLWLDSPRSSSFIATVVIE